MAQNIENNQLINFIVATTYRGVGVCFHSSTHYSDVKMGATESQITSLTIDYSTVYSGEDQRKYQSSVSLAFVREIHRWPVNSPHKWPVTRIMFPFDDVIMPLHAPRTGHAVKLQMIYLRVFFFNENCLILKKTLLDMILLYPADDLPLLV